MHCFYLLAATAAPHPPPSPRSHPAPLQTKSAPRATLQFLLSHARTPAGSPLLSRSTEYPARADSIISSLIPACVIFGRPNRFPTLVISALRRTSPSTSSGTRSP